MKTWQIYTLIGFAACITVMQIWTTYLAVQSTVGVPIKAEQYLKKIEINKKLNGYITTRYYWKSIPKDELTEEYAQKEIDDIMKRGKGKIDLITAEENVHDLLIYNHGEEYVGTLYETDNDVIIVTKKTETNYISPDDSLYTDPDNPDPFASVRRPKLKKE